MMKPSHERLTSLVMSLPYHEEQTGFELAVMRKSVSQSSLCTLPP